MEPDPLSILIIAIGRAIAWGAVMIWLAYIMRPVLLAWIAAA